MLYQESRFSESLGICREDVDAPLRTNSERPKRDVRPARPSMLLRALSLQLYSAVQNCLRGSCGFRVKHVKFGERP